MNSNSPTVFYTSDKSGTKATALPLVLFDYKRPDHRLTRLARRATHRLRALRPWKVRGKRSAELKKRAVTTKKGA